MTHPAWEAEMRRRMQQKRTAEITDPAKKPSQSALVMEALIEQERQRRALIDDE
jgi:hypothetical protein